LFELLTPLTASQGLIGMSVADLQADLDADERTRVPRERDLRRGALGNRVADQHEGDLRRDSGGIDG
jgi:hypothetical protein